MSRIFYCYLFWVCGETVDLIYNVSGVRIWDFSERRAGGKTGKQDARNQSDVEQPQQDHSASPGSREEDWATAKCQDQNSGSVRWHFWA